MRLGRVLEASWGVLGASWSVLGSFGSVLERLGASGARLEASWARFDLNYVTRGARIPTPAGRRELELSRHRKTTYRRLQRDYTE